MKVWQEILIFTFPAHSPTFLSCHLHHSSFSNPSIASPMSQLILQPFFHFSYITGSSLTSPGKPPMGQTCIDNGQRITFCRPLEKELRMRLVKCFVRSVALHDVKTWTLRRNEQNQLEVFEMWIWRRMEHVKWTDKINKRYGHTAHTFSRLMFNVIIWEIYFYIQWISDDW